MGQWKVIPYPLVQLFSWYFCTLVRLCYLLWGSAPVLPHLE